MLRAIIHEFNILIKLSRLNNPIPILILFYPCCFTLFLVPIQTANDANKRIATMIICLLGSVLARTIGCIINDIVDRDIDCMVSRTKNRPLASRELKVTHALILLLILFICSLTLLYKLSHLALILCVVGALMTIIYPFMKYITNYPQIFLGLTFNIGALVSYANIMNQLSWASILMYLGCVFWTTGYDTIYAFSDVDDDKKLQLKSLTLVIKEKWYKKYLLAVFYMTFIILFITSVLISYLDSHKLPISFNMFMFAAITSLIWQVISLDISNATNCLYRFKSNAITGALLCMAILHIV